MIFCWKLLRAKSWQRKYFSEKVVKKFAIVYLPNILLISFYYIYFRCFTLKTFRKKWPSKMVLPNVDWENTWKIFRPFLFAFLDICSLKFYLIMLFVKLTYWKCSISFFLSFWNMLFTSVWSHYSHLTRGTQRLGICSEKQVLPRIFYSLRTAKNLYLTVPFMYNFRSLSNKFTTIFWRLIFQILLPRLGYFSQKKETKN